MKKIVKSYVEKWETIDWPKIERYVSRLQKAIYTASQKREIEKVRKIQRILLDAWQTKLLATRRVTQDNTGKKTAGVDGIKSITSAQRLTLATELKLNKKADPVRRVWIPKPGTEEKRPLGIPTIHDRALQALVKMAIEPEWEAIFEPDSYGFRPGRSCHDAIKQIVTSIQNKPKYVLDTDISKCFDKIDHKALLNKLGYKGRVRDQIKAWLKSGILDGDQFTETIAGTPQGGVISPLLANIALHGMETKLKEYIEEIPLRYPSGKVMSKRDRIHSLAVIRYADDLVIMHESKQVVQRCKEILTQLLREMGLELKEEKTRMAHTFYPEQSEDGKAGIDFLGFTIKQYPTKYHSATAQKENVPDLRTLVYPSAKTCSRQRKKMHQVIINEKIKDQSLLIKKLNPIITGWTNYFAISDGSTTRTFNSMDNTTYLMLRRWAKRISKTSAKAHKKYWKHWHRSKSGMRERIEFRSNERTLVYHRDVASGKSLVKYTKVKGTASPFDGNAVYWASRLGHSLDISPSQAKMLKRQKGRCAWCKLMFKPGELIETDHIIPKGPNSYKNLQLLHRHCHDTKTARDKEKSLGTESIAE